MALTYCWSQNWSEPGSLDPDSGYAWWDPENPEAPERYDLPPPETPRPSADLRWEWVAGRGWFLGDYVGMP